MRALSYGNYSVAIFSAACVLLGLACALDLGGLGTRMLTRLREDEPDRVVPGMRTFNSMFAGFYRRLPDWTMRAFGLWAIAFGIGMFFLAP